MFAFAVNIAEIAEGSRVSAPKPIIVSSSALPACQSTHHSGSFVDALGIRWRQPSGPKCRQDSFDKVAPPHSRTPAEVASTAPSEMGYGSGCRCLASGQTRKSVTQITTSALPTADIPESGCDVRKVPKADVQFPPSGYSTHPSDSALRPFGASICECPAPTRTPSRNLRQEVQLASSCLSLREDGIPGVVYERYSRLVAKGMSAKLGIQHCRVQDYAFPWTMNDALPVAVTA